MASWTVDIGARNNGGLAVVGDTVFASSFLPAVIAIDIRSGAVKWKAIADNVVMSTPIVSPDMVFVGTGTDHQISRRVWGRSGGDAILALDRATGRELWRYRTVGEDMPSPVLAGKSLVFANGDGHAYSLASGTGKLIWKTKLEGVSTMASANRSGKDVLVSTCTTHLSPGHTTAIRVADGSIHWRVPYGNCDSSPTVVGGQVFVSGVDLVPTSFGIGYRAVVVALNASSGRLRWRYRSSDLGFSSMAVSSERAVAGTYANRMYFQSLPTHDRVVAFDAGTGRVRWSLQTLGPAKMSPIVDHGRLYVGDTVGCLYTVDIKTGKLLNMRTFKSPFSTSPAVIVDRTLLVTVGTTINAFPLYEGIPHQSRRAQM
jgi:outer membrane protein assembly factor BamB